MLNQLSIATAGFSIISLGLLVFQRRAETGFTKLLAVTLLCVLMCIQFLHIFYFSNEFLFEKFYALIYLLLMGSVGPLFYLYSQHVIQPQRAGSLNEVIHFIPAIILASVGTVYPAYFSLVYIIIFLLGGFYMSCLAMSLYRLRNRRTLFRMEFLLTAGFLSWALIVVATGVFSAQAMEILIPAQTIMLSMAVVAALHIQLNYPHLLSSLEEIATKQYQTSTLLNVDCEAAKQKLRELMENSKIYQDNNLSLSAVADRLSLKPHQLSELVNTHLNKSFSAYLRQVRVQAAEVLLKSEPEVSVLAIGLTVGFSSQSAFYSAFREIHSVAPGQYRRQLLAG